MIQKHSFEAVWNENSTILILGSFPSVKSREINFFYGHPQNRFWKVLSAVLEKEIPSSTNGKRTFLLENRIALFDVIASCDIQGSSDASIKNVIPNDIMPILNGAKIKQIFVNGKTAATLYEKHIFKKCGIPAVTLPSTSPANAAWTLDKLIEKWGFEIKKYI
ncbi:MAG: DNA-deoxyinosine glycosylase [Clostridia bacterium]|nr:DNA-deoxyinosine glycosylase [Clostridia bacterium]